MTDPQYKYFDELESTNTYAMRNIADLNDGDVIIASRQTKGRGRLGRKWVSGTKDNVYISIVLKPILNIAEESPLANITQYMSVIICRILANYGISSNIKWPNDVLVNGQKIAGILSEASIQGSSLKGYVLGLGLNLNMSNEDINKIDQPATSLNILTGKSIDREIFIKELVNEFNAGYKEFLNKGFCLIKSEYINRCSFIGQEILVTAPSCTTRGVAAEINNDGSLKLINEEKVESKVTIGDVTCLQMA